MNEKNVTDRTLERKSEDQSYVSVIVKRNDQAIRHPDDILKIAIAEAVEEHQKPVLSLLLSSMSAGLIVGFAGMCVALMSQVFPMAENPLINRLACALVYPLGFIVCIMSGTQLFTEQTATAFYSVLDRKSSILSLIRLWSMVLIGNLIGTYLSSHLLNAAEPVINASLGFSQIFEHLIHFKYKDVFFSGLLAGWLMAQGGWLRLATPPGSAQILSIFVVTFIIGFGGLHHSVAGSAEIFNGLLHVKDPDYVQGILFILSNVLGNIVGGSVFVAALNYAHIKKTQT